MEMAKLINDQGLICLAAFVAPQAAIRQKAAELIGPERFIVIHCAASLEQCMQSDNNGIYAEAASGNLEGVPGVSFDYETPTNADLILQSGTQSTQECVEEVLKLLHARSILG